MGHFITIVPRSFQRAVPLCLSCVDPVSALFRRHFIARIVKQIKFKLRSDDHTVCNAAFFHILHSPQAYILGILVKRLIFPLPDGTHIAAHGQCGHLRKRIHISSIRIWQKYHIAFLNGSIAVIRTVKTNSIGKSILSETFHRNRNVPPAAVNVRHLEINHANLFFFAQLLDLFDFTHNLFPFPALYSALLSLVSTKQMPL